MFSLKRVWGASMSAQVVVDAPPDQVFNYVTDFHHHHEWFMQWAGETEKTSQGPVGVGSTFTRGRWEWFGLRSYPIEAVVTEYVPNERLAYETRAPGGICGSTSIHLEPEPVSGGIRVTVRIGTVRDPWWRWPLMVLLLPVDSPVKRRLLRRKVQGMGPRLKEYYQTSA